MGIIQEAKATCTTMFLLPFLKIPKDKLLSNGFVDAFIGDINSDVQHNQCLYLLSKPKSTEKFAEFYADQVNNNKNFVDDYDPAKGWVVMVYKIPGKFLDDYQKFLEGRYSEFSEEAKAAIPKTVSYRDEYGRIKDKMSLQHEIMRKGRFVIEKLEEELGMELPDNIEVWEVPNKEKETLDIKRYIK